MHFNAQLTKAFLFKMQKFHEHTRRLNFQYCPKVWGSIRFFLCFFFFERSLNKTAFIWSKTSVKNSNIMKYYYFFKITVFYFPEHSFSSVSHDSSEIILICWFDAQSIYYKNIFFQDYLKIRKFKGTAFIWNVLLVSLLINFMHPCLLISTNQSINQS